MSPSKAEMIESRELAALIIDALLRAGLLEPSKVERAVAITEEEIEVRKAMGDL